MERIDEKNTGLYLHPPSQEQIDAYVKKMGVTDAHFERFFKMPKGTIKVVRTGYMQLPKKWWHLFFIAKEYKTQEEYAKDVYYLLNPRKKRPSKKVRKKVRKSTNVAPITDNNRIQSLK